MLAGRGPKVQLKKGNNRKGCSSLWKAGGIEKGKSVFGWETKGRAMKRGYWGELDHAVGAHYSHHLGQNCRSYLKKRGQGSLGG